jgi:hypothetical protein
MNYESAQPCRSVFAYLVSAFIRPGSCGASSERKAKIALCCNCNLIFTDDTILYFVRYGRVSFRSQTDQIARGKIEPDGEAADRSTLARTCNRWHRRHLARRKRPRRVPASFAEALLSPQQALRCEVSLRCAPRQPLTRSHTRCTPRARLAAASIFRKLQAGKGPLAVRANPSPTALNYPLCRP